MNFAGLEQDDEGNYNDSVSFPVPSITLKKNMEMK